MKFFRLTVDEVQQTCFKILRAIKFPIRIFFQDVADYARCVVGKEWKLGDTALKIV